MVRTRRGNVAAKRRKKSLKLAKGCVGSQSKLATLAGEQVIQSLNFAYVGRRLENVILDVFGYIVLMLLVEHAKTYIHSSLVVYVI